MADLAEAAADAGPLLDDGLGLLGGARRVLQEVFLQGTLCRPGALGLVPAEAAEARQAALEVLVEVALDGAPGDVGVGGDLGVGQAVALQPEDFHLALDAGVGVVVAVVGEGPPIVGGEGYMYRPTREGDFLRELLKDFHGVLVSDFYAAYDAIECPQQNASSTSCETSTRNS